MPFSSTDIASLTGGFNQQVMLQQQQAAMLTHQFGGYAPNPAVMPVASQGEQFAGLAMNQFANMGMSALGSQRLNQFGGGIAAPFAQTGQFLMGQMAYGAQQQQMLDVNLRQSYRFPNAFGGRGFSANETAMIGSGLRGMSHQRGPGGEVTSFEELGQLAANMGRMGMADGVRSVREFNEKFRTMLQSVKTIATELGTSLEEAQKVMASLKGSGIFRNQGQFAGLMRQGAIAGNISIAEMSASALMGAQISRSVGGLGRSGAYAGINTMSNIGAATQAGVISEEDIYNTTGLAGAEGRQAMAQNMMSMDARFFSSALGRRALAGMAGKNGTLNSADVLAFSSGSVGTEDTMSMARRNLAGVGRANFIRNEGRLRGAAMEAFGGLGVASIARGWLDSKGLDLNEDNDRAMLFLQRKMGLGRDEADQAVKMARNLDRIKMQIKASNEDDRYQKRQDEAERATRPEELVKKLEMARTQINDGLRDLGASFYKSTASAIQEFMDKQVGGYARNRQADLTKIIRQLESGGDNSGMIRREFGLYTGQDGKLRREALSEGVSKAHDVLYGKNSGTLTDRQASRYVSANMTSFGAAGYNIEGIRSVAGLRAVEDRALKNQLAFSKGGMTDDLKANWLSDRGMATDFAERIASGQISGSGAELLESFGNSDIRFGALSEAERAAALGSALKSTGLSDAFGLDRMDAPTAVGMGWGGKYASLEAEQGAVGRSILGTRSRFADGSPTKFAQATRTFGAQASGILGDRIGGLFGKGSLLERGASYIDSQTRWANSNRVEIGKTVGDTVGGLLGPGIGNWAADQAFQLAGGFDGDVRKGLTAYVTSSENMGDLAGMNGDAMQRFDSMESVLKKMTELQSRKQKNGKLTAEETARLEGMRGTYARGKINELGKDATPEQLEHAASTLGFESAKQMQEAADFSSAAVAQEQDKKFAAYTQETRNRANESIKTRDSRDKEYAARVASGEIKLDTKEAKAADEAANAYIKSMRGIQDIEASYSGTVEGAAGDAEKFGIVQEHRKGLAGMRAIGTVAQRRATARALAQKGMTDEANQMNAELNAEVSLDRAAKADAGRGKGNVARLGAVSGLLGAGLSRKDFAQADGGAGVDKMMESLGLGSGSSVSAEKREEIRKEITALTTGKDENGKKLSNADLGQRAAKLQAREELVQGAREKQDKTSLANDPNARRLDNINDSLGKLLVPMNKSAEHLATIKKNLVKE